MKKKIKILVIFNFISYVVMTIVAYIMANNLSSRLSNGIKFLIGSIPLILIFCTSFILASDRTKEFKVIKIEAIFDWVIRIISFGVVLKFSDNLEHKYSIFMFIVLAFIINSIIEYCINRKLINVKEEVIEKEKEQITYEEKSNIKSIVKAINFGMMSVIVFGGGALSVPVTKNMEGTTMWYVPVVVSILVFIWFVNTMYNNYVLFYIDKQQAKSIFLRDIIVASIGYVICLITSFLNLSQELYSCAAIIGILFTLPTIGTIRKMSIRLKFIKDNLDKDTFNEFLLKK